MRVSSILPILFLALPRAASAQSYASGQAVQYASDWWKTDTNGDGTVDHINNPNEACLGFIPTCTPAPEAGKNFLFYATDPATNASGTSSGAASDNSFAVRVSNGDDCTNFASQVLIGGGVSFDAVSPAKNPLNHNKAIFVSAEGTLPRVKDMYVVLPSIATRIPFNFPGPVPGALKAGDILQWSLGHTSVINRIDSQGNPHLAQHTADTFDGIMTCNNCGVFAQFGTYDRFVLVGEKKCLDKHPLDHCAPFKDPRSLSEVQSLVQCLHDDPSDVCNYAAHSPPIPVTGWHITGTAATAKFTNDIPAPSLIVRDHATQNIFNDGSQMTASNIDVTATPSNGVAIVAFEVIQGGEILDSMNNINNLTAAYVAQDYAVYPAGHLFQVDLSKVADGPLVVQVLDETGNLTVQKFSMGTNASPSVTMLDLLPTRSGAVPDYLYENFTGAGAVTPSTLLPSSPDPNFAFNLTAGLFAWVNASPALASVVLTGPRGVTATLPPGTTSYFLNMPAPLPVGTYTLTAIDTNGHRTITPVTVASMNAAIVSQQLVASPINSCVLSGQITLDLSASMNLDHLTMVNALQPPFPTPSTFSTLPLSGSQQRITLTIPSMAALPFTFASTAFVSLFDSDGNTVAVNLRPFFAPILQPNGTFLNHCDPTMVMGQSPMIRTTFDTQGVAANEYAPIGLGASVSNLQLPGAGGSVTMDVFLENAPHFTAGGYQSASNGLMYGLMVEGTPTQPFTLTLPVSASVNPNLLADLAVTMADAAGNISPPRPVSLQGLQASFPVSVPANTSPFVLNSILEVPPYPNPTILSANGASLVYNGALNSGITMTPADPTQQPLSGLLAQALSLGLSLDGPVFLLGPENTTLGSAAYLTLPAYASGGSIFELSPGLPPQPLNNQSGAYQTASVSGSFSKINSYFAVFKSTPVSAPSDALPPRTALVVGAPQFGVAPVFISSSTSLSLYAVDDSKALGDGAGTVARTFISIDSATFTPYAGTFTISSPGTHSLQFYSTDAAGNSEAVHSSMVAVDATPPSTTVNIGAPSFTNSGGTLYVATTTPVAFTAVDPSSASVASGVAFTHYRLAQAPAFSTGAFQIFVAPFSLAEGFWRVDFQSQDHVANLEPLKSSSVFVDATPPVSSLVIGVPQYQLSSATVLVSALTPLTISAVDPVVNGIGSGVGATFRRVSDAAPSGAPFSLYNGTFTLNTPDVPKVIQFYSQDNVQNMEAVESASLLLDSTPPEVALLSPGSCDGGICRVLKGKVPVLGTARDLHFAGYVLDAAPGQNATTGYVLVGSGAVAVSSGTLGTWDASALAGWQTLRLTATDLVANTSVIALNVFVGDPSLLMALGNHDVFDMPQGVAADAAGDIYVADTNADRIAVYSATGTFLAAFGRRGDDDDRARLSGVRLSKPRGVAVDAAGHIFIADTNDNRILKLSSTGQLLLAVGRLEKRDKDDVRERAEFAPGRGAGEFDKPSGIALDVAGNIFVADTNNGRVQKLAPDGTPQSSFALPPLPASRAPEDKDHHDDHPATGRPFGIALDAAGRIYVTDPAGGRALVFSATGQLLLTLPITGTSKDGKTVSGAPTGVAVSTDGFCLLVSDQRLDRILKFDSLGAQTLSFGAPGMRGRGDDKPSAGISLRRPAGLALAPDGILLIADRNDDRVLRVGLPTGAPTLVAPLPQTDHDDAARDVLERDGGGTVARRDGASVTVPPGALADDLKITVSTMSSASVGQAGAMGQVASNMGLRPAYAPVEYGPEGTRFGAPVLLVVPYNPQLIAALGLSEDSLKVHYWNKASGAWEALASVIDKNARTVSARTPHFSLYQVLGSTAGASGIGVLAADATFGLKAAYAFPSPVHSGAVTIRIQPGLADSVEVHVYDVAGRKVHSSSDFQLSTLDDGNGLGAQFTYDHAWDISGVGSGVYTYVITARKAGQSDIHKTGRFGVVK